MEIRHGSAVETPNLLRLLRLTDLEDQTFTGELRALLRHRLFEVVHLHDMPPSRKSPRA
jgi:hypothetical protein